MIGNSAANRRFLRLFIIAAMTTAVAAPAPAGEIIWFGALSDEWTSGPNWGFGGPPQAADDALLSEVAFRFTVNVGVPSECAVLRFDGAIPYTLIGTGLTVNSVAAPPFGTPVTHTLNLEMTPSSAGTWNTG